MPQSDIAPHIPRPLLLTLGRLELSFNALRQDKLLLLLAYLNLEGTKGRKFVAELFWPEATNPMNSLAVALKKLREAGAAEADTARVWATVGCDALLLREHLRAGRLAEAVALYGGPFGEGVATKEKAVHGEVQRLIGEELEEWFFATREALASEVRGAWLGLAEQEAAAGRFIEAGAKAEAAYRLSGGPPLEAEELIRLYRLLLAAEHPLREALEREARELEVVLPQSAEAMRGKLRQTLIGRKRELETLLALEPGEWAWVRGGDGMGKTALLKELEAKTGWRYLPARSGLPFATLEPLVRDIEGGEEAVLRRLARTEQSLLIDDWDNVDPSSQQVIVRLRTFSFEGRAILAGAGEAPSPVEHLIELTPLHQSDLSEYPGAFEATDGVPGLLSAWLHHEPLDLALETRLARRSAIERQVYGALALLDEPNLTLVHQALGLEAKAVAQAFERLISAGLIEHSGQVLSRNAALAYLEDRFETLRQTSLGLARALPPQQALPLYRRAKGLIEESDLPQVRKAYISWAEELVRRGFPKQAADELVEAPKHPEVGLLRARALERAGFYKETIEVVEQMEESPEILAVMASAWFNLGETEAAFQAASKAQKGKPRPRAEAYNVLGKIEMYKGNFEQADRFFKRAATLWLGEGDHPRYVDTLTNQAITRCIKAKGQLDNEVELFSKALEAAGNHQPSRALVLLNLGMAVSNRDLFDQAISYTVQARDIAEESGSLSLVVAALSNMGSFYQHMNEPIKAQAAYFQSLTLARTIGDRRLIGINLWQLAFLEKNIDAVDEALNYLEEAGFISQAGQFRRTTQQFMASSSGIAHP